MEEPVKQDRSAPAMPRVLVVDDESGFRDMLQWHLRGQDLAVDVAHDGGQAMSMIEVAEYALVITDLTMPKLDGLTLLSALKRKSPHAEVILMTGFGTVELAVDAMQKGAFDFILKPFDINRLTQRVKEALAKQAERKKV